MESAVRSRLAQLLRDAPDDAEAIEFEGRWWTWAAIRSAVAGIAAELRAAGLGPAGRVGVVLENRPEHVCAVLAILTSDRCLVTMSPLQPPERLAADIGRSTVPILIASPDVLARPGVQDAAAASGLVLRLDSGGRIERAAGAMPAEPVPSPGTAVEMLTSGTTGPPKRVRLSDRQLDAGMVSGGQAPPADKLLRSGVSLVHTPLVHIGGLWGILATLYVGRRAVLFPRWVLETWVSAIEKYRPRASGLVPAALRTVIDADVPREKLSSLKAITSGTAPCPPEVADKFQNMYGIRVLTTYGATEFAGAVAGWTLPLNVEWWDRKKGSAGRAFPGAQLRVVSPDSGEELPAGTVGILEIRSAQAPGGAGHWQRTSDLAEIDEDGFLWIRGRADDAIIRGGFKIHPDAVKTVLERHPAVLEAAVAGKPDRRLGQVPVAAVELRVGARPPDPAELIALCRQHLIPYEVPTEVLVVEQLPRGPSMKVSRPDLLDLFAAG
ncbi:Acyl-CoA synthetase (AMP-forming)/AMP-acid ligase II [Cryptosporangium aurantiacum]|uniref:Acyl-CoA synthetase (AMP-forming)/AMP-acid ligase II n=2 Tax=Cryptosporangium aurantiacum TaxID=134849 RepID=A0A1M7R4R7_9ACTN|nr:Acyl-CoA synthetase (AMP-forming)/AMP-acid ligase II [Cryptosporangium aurantiacum]